MKADIEAKVANPEYISILSLVEEANAEYTMLVSAGRGGPKGELDQVGASEMLYTKAELNNLFKNR